MASFNNQRDNLAVFAEKGSELFLELSGISLELKEIFTLASKLVTNSLFGLDYLLGEGER